MSLEDLQTVLDRSLERATEFTRSLFAATAWDAAKVQQFANEFPGLTAATIDGRGQPHAAPVISGCVDGTIYFSVSCASALRRNLDRNATMAFTITGPGHAVMGQGRASLAGIARDLDALASGLPESSNLRRLIADDWDGLIYGIALTRVFAN